MENDALKKRVINALRHHNLQIDEDDPVIELAVMHQVLFKHHLDALNALLEKQTEHLHQTHRSMTDQCQNVFVALTERLKTVKLKPQRIGNDRSVLKVIFILTFINSAGLIFVIGKILGLF